MRTMLLVTCGVVALGCDDPRLPPAQFRNTVDTVRVYAITGTEVFRPSGYAMTEARPVRLDLTNNADFAFDITADGRRVLLPGYVIGQPGSRGIDPGLQKTSREFEDIRVSVSNGYITRDTVSVVAGDVFYLRGRIPASCFLGLPIYGKMRVLGIDPEERVIALEILVNFNCGYRSLEEGLPGG